MARVKIRRTLVPAAVLLASLITAFWLYLSYERLELFTLRNKDSSAGACSNYPTSKSASFKQELTGFLSSGTDSSLKSTLISCEELIDTLGPDPACPSIAEVHQNLENIRSVLFETIHLRLRQLDSMLELNPRKPIPQPIQDSIYALRSNLASLVILEYGGSGAPDTAVAIASSPSQNTRFSPVVQTTMESGFDSLKMKVSGHLDLFLEAESNLHDQMLLEEKRLRKAMVDHGMMVDRARYEWFLLTLVCWISSLLLISGFYVSSVFKRTSIAMEGPVHVPDAPSSFEKKLDKNGPEPELSVLDEPIVAVASGVDLSKLFFKCGGDVQLMRQMLNRYLTATFATAHNLKAYSNNPNMDSASRMLQTLFDSSTEMGFDSIAVVAQKNLVAIRSRANEDSISVSLNELSAILFDHIAMVKSQMGKHPAFK